MMPPPVEEPPPEGRASRGAGPALPTSGAVEPLGIRAVSELLGLPAPTIRSWERRYRLRATARSAGGHRRYGAGEVDVLRRIRDGIARGLSARQAATMAAADANRVPADLVEAICSQTHALDSQGISASLDRARAVCGLDATVDEVLLPAMREIGRQWAAGSCDIAHEQAASSAVRTWLAGVQREGPALTRTGAVVLACGPSDAHTIGLHALSALLTHRGVDSRSLGACTPARSLVLAVQRADAAAVVVVSHLTSSRADAVEALRAVAATPAEVYYAGEGFRSGGTRSDLPGTYLGESIADAADRVAALSTRLADG